MTTALLSAKPTPRCTQTPLARHLLAEYYGCRADLLDDAARLETVLRGTAEAARTTIINVQLHQFAPQGVSGVVILAESHLAIHTWPEHGFASVELYVCGDDALPGAGHAFLRAALQPRHWETRMIGRGDMDLVERFPAPPA